MLVASPWSGFSHRALRCPAVVPCAASWSWCLGGHLDGLLGLVRNMGPKAYKVRTSSFVSKNMETDLFAEMVLGCFTQNPLANNLCYCSRHCEWGTWISNNVKGGSRTRNDCCWENLQVGGGFCRGFEIFDEDEVNLNPRQLY